MQKFFMVIGSILGILLMATGLKKAYTAFHKKSPKINQRKRRVKESIVGHVTDRVQTSSP